MKNLFYWVLLATLFAACHKDSKELEVPEPDILLLSAHEFKMSEEGGTFSVEVYCNTDYTVSIPDTCQSWLHETATSKSIGQIRNFTVATNNEKLLRTGYIILCSDGQTDTIRVLQAASGEEQHEDTNDFIILLMNGHKFDVPDKGGYISIETNSTFECEATIPEEYQSWISEAPATKGGLRNVRRFAIATNNVYQPREGFIVFGDEGTTTDTVYVSQGPKAGVTWGARLFHKIWSVASKTGNGLCKRWHFYDGA